MNSTFADTFFFLAMLNPRDEAHANSVAFMRSHRGPMVTTTWVLTELADALAETDGRPRFGGLLSRLKSDARITIVSTSDDLFDQGTRLYIDRPDKGWSLTDCISFTVMEREGITEALTADHRFEQAGFVALLK